MKAIISLKDDTLLVYRNIKEVRVQFSHLIIRCNEAYSVNSQKTVRQYNISTKPYEHCFYGGRIIRCNED